MPAESPTPLPEVVRTSYGARLALAMAVAVAVVVGFGVVVSTQASATLQDDVRTDLTRLSETRTAQMDSWLGTVEREVSLTARHRAVRSGDPDRVDEYIERRVDAGQVPRDVVAIHYVNARSMEVLRSSKDELEGLNAREQGAPFATDPPSFESPDDVYISQPFTIGPVSHPVIAAVTPVPGVQGRALIFMTDVAARSEAFSDSRGDTATIVVDSDGNYVAHPNTSKIRTGLTGHQGMDLQSLEPGNTTFMEHGEMLMAMSAMETKDWIVMIHSSTDAAYALGHQINADLAGLVLLMVITLGLVGVTIGLNTLVSVRRVAVRARSMADGDLDVDLATTREDEIGRLYRSFRDMRDAIRETIREAETAREEAEAAREDAEEAKSRAETEAAEMEEMTTHLEAKATEYGDVLAAAAAGDLTRRADGDSDSDAMASVGDSINEALDAIERTIAEMQAFADDVIAASERVGENADRVDRASRQVTTSIEEIFEGTTEQSSGLQSAAGEMETLSATAEEVASSAQEVATTSEQAAGAGEEGREAARRAIEEMNAIDEETEETVRAINELDDELDEIGEIVGVITAIVEQTNMLALNASIEAAHADGEGEGFAVVADEIKGLAAETKEAAGDIEDRIERIQAQADETTDRMEATSERVAGGVETVEAAVDALEEIVAYTEEVDTGIREIDDATEEQARTAQEAMALIDDLSTISQQTAAEADTVADAADDQSQSIGRVADSARELRERADELDEALARFRTRSGVDAAETTATAATDD